MNIDPNNWVHASDEGLAQYIEDNMPSGQVENCMGQCAADVAEFVKGLQWGGAANGRNGQCKPLKYKEIYTFSPVF